MSQFEIGADDFLLDGRPVQILSGALHYFRLHPDQWRDRLTRARELGLNTIETYIPWNAHSRTRGEFRTDGILDLGRFLDEVAAQGMHAIVRPGPYICAEWTGGGLPGWLFTDGAGVRRHEPTYLAAIQEYYEAVAEIVVPRQVDRGGPVILVQVENEYGAYGADKEYLAALVTLLRDSGITTPLTTIDQPEPAMLENGSLPGLHMTGSFGSRVTERLATLRAHQPTGPLMCAEFWDGWFDSWGLHHHTTDAAASARELDDLLSVGASVNLYMLCGGTNFGFTNGANDKGTYVPIVTSYDYDAPLDEAGRPTAKYWAFREVLAKYTDVPEVTAPPRTPAPTFTVPLVRRCPVWDVLDLLGDEQAHDHLPTVDALGHFDGFTLYRALDDATPGVLELAEVRDRAQVFVDRAPVAVLSRDHGERRAVLPACGPPGGAGRGPGTGQLRSPDRGAQGPHRPGDAGRRRRHGLVHPAARARRRHRGHRGRARRGTRRRPDRRRTGVRARARSTPRTPTPTCSSTPPTGARASCGSTASASDGSGRGRRSARCTCPRRCCARRATRSWSSCWTPPRRRSSFVEDLALGHTEE